MVFTELGLAIVVMILTFLICLWLLFRYIDRITPYQKGIDLFLFVFSIQAMARHYYNWTVDGLYYNYLPLQICYFTAFIYMYYYVSNDRRTLPFLHIFGFLGVGALVIPGHAFSFTNPLSYVFMFDHIVLGLMPFYLIVAHKYYPEYPSIRKVLLWLIPIFFLSIPLSNLLGANYFFIISNPVTADLINPWLAAVIQLILMYGWGLLATYLGQWILGVVYPESRKQTV